MMAWTDNQLARREDDRIAVRPDALRADWMLKDLVSADGYAVVCHFGCGVRALDQPTERKMLAETFLGGKPAVTLGDVVARLAPAIAAAADKATVARQAGALLGDDARKAMALSLRQVAENVAFNCGLELLAPFEAELESPPYRRMLLEQGERERAGRRVEAQTGQLAKARELLATFESLRAAAPELAPGAILDRLAPSDRGTALTTLLMAEGRKSSRPVLAVSGNHLVRIDPDSTGEPLIEELPGALGPLRSVMRTQIDGRETILLGARDGVWRIDGGIVAGARAYADPGVDSGLGFSRAVAWNDRLWACHGDGGVVMWQWDAPDAPAMARRPGDLATGRDQGVRAGKLTVLDAELLLLADGPGLWAMGRDGSARELDGAVGGAIVGIFVMGDEVVTIQDDGMLRRRDAATLGESTSQRLCGSVTAAAALPWMGGARLLLATAEGPVRCVALDDPLITQYLSAHRGLRSVSASGRAVAGLSADRSRVVLWDSWDGGRPAREIPLTPRTRHRVADIEA